MVEAGLLRKVPYRGEQRTHHEYVLTEAGADLLPVLNALLLWGEKHTAATASRRRDGHLAPALRRRSRPRPTSARTAATDLHADDVAWLRSWRTADPEPLTGAAI